MTTQQLHTRLKFIGCAKSQKQTIFIVFLVLCSLAPIPSLIAQTWGRLSSLRAMWNIGTTRNDQFDLALVLDLQGQIPQSTKQIVLVHAPSWDSKYGILERYRRSGSLWNKEGRPISVSLGANGMAWGVGLQKNQGPGPIKVEGDKRAPAGIFRLGPAFGYSKTKPEGVSLPYRQATAHSYFVDDPDSFFYNRWVERRDDSPPPWKSAERMKRQDHLYYLGLVVQQNTDPVIKGRGSAVFLHIRLQSDQLTSGCISMFEEDLMSVLRWLEGKDSLLLVVPDGEIKSLRIR